MEFSVGDYVWARMPGFPFWPAIIEDDTGREEPGGSGSTVFVWFCRPGKKSFGYVEPQNICRLYETFDEKMCAIDQKRYRKWRTSVRQSLRSMYEYAQEQHHAEVTNFLEIKVPEFQPATMRGRPPVTATPTLESDVDSDSSLQRDPDFVPSEDEIINTVLGHVAALETQAIPHIASAVLENLVTRVEEALKPFKPRKRQRNESLKDQRKRLKNRGEAHVNRLGKSIPAKRFIMTACKCHNQCADASEQHRKHIFEEFYQLDYQGQQSFLLKHASRGDVKRHRRSAKSTTARNATFSFTLTVDGERKSVCRQVFCDTLSISAKRLRLLFDREETQQGLTPPDRRGKHPCAFKYPDDVTEGVRSFLKDLPVNESHYRRSQSRRLYLQPGLTVKALYEEYSKKAPRPVKYQTFYSLWSNEFNYAFGSPRNDKCDQCEEFEVASPAEREELQSSFNDHLRRREQAFRSKDHDKAIAMRDPTVVVATFDLEKILVTPCTKVSNMYYKRKLSTFNFTVWNNATKDVHCYVWDESCGKKGSCEIATCVTRFLGSLGQEVRQVTFYSDTASSQNRNQALATAMLFFLATNTCSIESIQQKYMESGHSHMEVDAAHSMIERTCANKSVYTPSDWAALIRELGYVVVQPVINEWQDFLKMAKRIMQNRTVSDTGETVNWLLIKAILYTKKDLTSIYVKRELDELNWIRIPIQRKQTKYARKPIEWTPPSQLYSESQLPIATEKLKDLQRMAQKYIPSEKREFYAKLMADGNTESDDDDTPL